MKLACSFAIILSIFAFTDALPYGNYGQAIIAYNPPFIPVFPYSPVLAMNYRRALGFVHPKSKREIQDDPIADRPVPAPPVVAPEIVESGIKELADRLAHPEVNAFIKEILALPRPLLGVALKALREVNDRASNSAITPSENAIPDKLYLFEQFVGEGQQKGGNQLIKQDFQESQPSNELQLEDEPVETKYY